MFLTAATELTATLVLAPIGVQTLSTQFWAYQENASYGAAAPYALVMVGLAIVPGALLGLWFDRERHSAGSPMSAIELHGASKRFDDTAVLSGVDLAVADGSITAVLGASGSGKTTLLRLIAGFERLDGGTISIGGRVVDDGRRSVAAQHRGVGYVAQEGALFPHLTVAGNIGFGLSRRERASADHLLELTGLRRPPRAAIPISSPAASSSAWRSRGRWRSARGWSCSTSRSARSTPRCAATCGAMWPGSWPRRARPRCWSPTTRTRRWRSPMQVALLADGRVRAVAEPRDLYRDPPDVGTAEAIGEANILPAHLTAGVAHCALGAIPIRAAGGDAPADGLARVLLRPEQLAVLLHATDEGVAAGVVEVQYHGHDALARLRLHAGGDGGPTLLARIPGELDLEAGQQVWIEVLGSARAWSAAGDRTADRLRVG